ncbi:MAG: hypothetical protein HOP28_14685 [Gemmatimonadales bacterium]|nr:hypothetical protein [Gemmatimonadales bacterium]
MKDISISDWVLIATTIILATAAFLTPLVGEYIKHRWSGPVLRLSYAARPPGSHKTRLNVRLSEAQVEKCETYYFRLAIENDGKTQAHNCEVVLEQVWFGNSKGGLELLSQFGPIGLPWGSGYTDFVDINPSRVFFCDFLTIPDEAAQKWFAMFGNYIDFPGYTAGNNGLVLCTRAAFYSQPNRLPPGVYRFHVAVFAENATPVRAAIEVDWSGQWRSHDAEMFKECTVRQFARTS